MNLLLDYFNFSEESIMFSTSSQKKMWMFRDESDVANTRQMVNANFIRNRCRSMNVSPTDFFPLFLADTAGVELT